MSELKTLREINFRVPGNNTEHSLGNKYIKDELKYEAIKWVKAERLFFNQIGKVTLTPEMEMIYHARTWVKHFFNLSEEDLK